MRITFGILGALMLAACAGADASSSTFVEKPTSEPAQQSGQAGIAPTPMSDDSAPLPPDSATNGDAGTASQDQGTPTFSNDEPTGPVPEQEFPGGPMVTPEQDAGDVPTQAFPGGPMESNGYRTQRALRSLRSAKLA